MNRRSFIMTGAGALAVSGLAPLALGATKSKDAAKAPAAPKAIQRFGDGRDWYFEKRFGMFVHYGLYSIHGEGEWHMDRKMIPKEEYNVLADGFRAEKFDADELVGLAKRDEILVLAGGGEVALSRRDPGLKLLQYVRDEAHRFCRRYFHLLQRDALRPD